MTKGLHKNSLRKVDNPHQWMIDDARMELIQQIKAEVERLKKEQPARNAIGAICGEETVVDASKLLSVLDNLQEPIDKWSNKERKARVKKTGEIVCGFTDGQGHFDIPTDHNEFIRYNLDELELDTLQEQPVDWQKVAEAHAKDQPLGQDNDGNLVYLQEHPVCEGLEEEITKWFAELDKKYGVTIDFGCADIESTARHFAKWGAEHLKK